MLRVIAEIALIVLLTACGSVGTMPNAQLIERAIALQLSQSQTELSQQLRLDISPTITIKRLKITERLPLQIENLQAFHVKGTCDLAIDRSTRHIIQPNTPFDLFLQRQAESKTWRLAYPKIDPNGERFWATQRVPTEQF